MGRTTYIALLRAVNLGDQKRVAMADLRALFEGLGYSNVRTLLASGNVVFTGKEMEVPGLERRLQGEAARRLGLQTPIIVRTAPELSESIAHNPFPRESEQDPAHVVVVFLRDAPSEAGWESLRAAATGPEVVRAWGRHAYVYYAAGIGNSRLTGALIDRQLGTVGTGRNWSTVTKIAAAASG
jgi:uncharacterized protein (DUF1697 family)